MYIICLDLCLLVGGYGNAKMCTNESNLRNIDFKAEIAIETTK